MLTKYRQSQKDRLQEVYRDWVELQSIRRAHANKTLFALELGYESHSAIAEMMNGKRDIAAAVAIKCRENWEISPTWLLCGDGPKYCYQVVEPGDIYEQIGQLIANAIARASTKDLPLDGGVADLEAQGLRVGVDVSEPKPYRIDARAAVEKLCNDAVEEAKAIAEWREEWQIRTAVDMANSKGGPEWVDPLAFIASPWVKRAAKRWPSPPPTTVVHGA